ncbi:MAG: bifunctional oligoribonuclease/PAP phosphatase NrnA [Deltaproteobacteria bacterium]|nr:bifunctional oligoribonuclease/PAP phosphatase NrnA [Deltaproteobacteria bacterium]
MLRRISERIGRHRVFLITAHERLDGDALGSELALGLMLKSLGKEVVVYNQDPTPGNYLFLPGSDRIVHELPPIGPFEVAFVLDCGELNRVGRESARIGTIPDLVNIDHHVSNGGFCDVRLIDPQASSTGELIFRLVRDMNLTVTGEMATCLYTAILTDTGGFRYGNTNRGALLTAADLVAGGADPQWISENVYESDPPARIRLLAAILPTLRVEEGGRVGSLIVTQKALADAGALPEHTERFVDLPRSIRGVEIAILYSELPDGRYKLSLRSKGKINVERVARAFGGGGHINASGCLAEGEQPEIRRKVIEAIRTSAAKP